MNKKIIPMLAIGISVIVVGTIVFNIPKSEIEEDDLGPDQTASWT